MKKRRPGSSDSPAVGHEETPPAPNPRPEEYGDGPVPESWGDEWASNPGGTERETYEDRVERERD